MKHVSKFDLILESKMASLDSTRFAVAYNRSIVFESSDIIDEGIMDWLKDKFKKFDYKKNYFDEYNGNESITTAVNELLYKKGEDGVELRQTIEDECNGLKDAEYAAKPGKNGDYAYNERKFSISSIIHPNRYFDNSIEVIKKRLNDILAGVKEIINKDIEQKNIKKGTSKDEGKLKLQKKIEIYSEAAIETKIKENTPPVGIGISGLELKDIFEKYDKFRKIIMNNRSAIIFGLCLHEYIDSDDAKRNKIEDKFNAPIKLYNVLKIYEETIYEGKKIATKLSEKGDNATKDYIDNVLDIDPPAERNNTSIYHLFKDAFDDIVKNTSADENKIVDGLKYSINAMIKDEKTEKKISDNLTCINFVKKFFFANDKGVTSFNTFFEAFKKTNADDKKSKKTIGELKGSELESVIKHYFYDKNRAISNIDKLEFIHSVCYAATDDAKELFHAEWAPENKKKAAAAYKYEFNTSLAKGDKIGTINNVDVDYFNFSGDGENKNKAKAFSNDLNELIDTLNRSSCRIDKLAALMSMWRVGNFHVENKEIKKDHLGDVIEIFKNINDKFKSVKDKFGFLRACWNREKPFTNHKVKQMSMKFSKELTNAFELIRRTPEFVNCFKDKQVGEPENLREVKLS